VLSEKPDKPEPPLFYSRYEMCKMLKISLPTLCRYVSLGILTGKRVGNRILFSQEDLNNALHEINRG
jgi:excisionase family DNA binding protein